MIRTLFPLIVLLLAASLPAQQSTRFRLEQHQFNSGGTPSDGVTASSTGYQISLDAIGDGVLGPTLSSGSWSLDPGLVGVLKPPGEVLSLLFSDGQTLVWAPEQTVGSYRLYRGPNPITTGTCLATGLPAALAIDAALPLAGEAFYYLVTAVNRLDEEGTSGFDSVPGERPNPTPCS